jgi:hypothetical protein
VLNAQARLNGPSQTFVGDQRADTLAHLIAPTNLLCCGHRVRVRRPYVRAADFVAIARAEPAHRGQAGLQRELWIGIHEITRGARERLRIAWRPARKFARHLELPGLLGRSKPLALLAGRGRDEVAQNLRPIALRILPHD